MVPTTLVQWYAIPGCVKIIKDRHFMGCVVLANIAGGLIMGLIIVMTAEQTGDNAKCWPITRRSTAKTTGNNDISHT